MRIALAQLREQFEQTEDFVTKVAQLMEEAAQAGARALFLPELANSAIGDSARAQQFAEPRGGGLFTTLASRARETGLALGYGFVEQAEEGLYNSYQVIDAQGSALDCYRKSYLYSNAEKALFQSAQGLSWFELDGLRFGTQICYDINFADLTLAHARAGVDVLLVPSASSQEFGLVPEVLCRARAIEVQTSVAFINHTGEKLGIRYSGLSSISYPDGEQRFIAPDASLLVVEVSSRDAYPTRSLYKAADDWKADQAGQPAKRP